MDVEIKSIMQTLDDLRHFTVRRNFIPPTTLQRAIQRMGFVQADPIRAPARAQDLILRQRVKNYRAGDLERRYSSLDVDEDFFVNYGFVTRKLQALMHPRSELAAASVTRAEVKQEQLLLEFVRERNAVHPREVDERFGHGRVTNYWGGSSKVTTRLLAAMHYRGLLRVTCREKGIRIYSASDVAPPTDAERERRAHTSASLNSIERDARIDALVDAVVRIYAPLPTASLSYYVRCLRYAAPQWTSELTSALQRAKERLAHAHVKGTDWFWAKESGPNALRHATQDRVRLLAPFDPLVHDRARFEVLWGWIYRFEAYTPLAKRKLGYYALPLLWGELVIGWANLSVRNNDLHADFGYVKSPPRERAFKRELEAELDRIKVFLGLEL